jgi:hypothetical protein
VVAILLATVAFVSEVFTVYVAYPLVGTTLSTVLKASPKAIMREGVKGLTVLLAPPQPTKAQAAKSAAMRINIENESLIIKGARSLAAVLSFFVNAIV